ncbi:MAG TPA: carbohydrate ABC transporter permease [Anaerolineae bacterium]|nr:carbohydrate ABC transporter permease [Anaerolineae bacterium]HPL27915.1 carbohydrate ABC transporter permease [Anaerolineae bacterium]
MSKKTSNRAQEGLVYSLLILMALFSLAPILWAVLTSFRTLTDTFARPINWLPKPFTFENYRLIWTRYPLGVYLQNSLIIAVVSVGASLLLGSLAAYGVSRYRIWGKRHFLTFVLLTQMFPYVTLLLPYFRVFTVLGLLDSKWALILTHLSFGLPFCIWMMKSFIDGIPTDLDDAAKVDGCNALQAFWAVVLPAAKPGLAATAVYAFLTSWNDYVFALNLTSSNSQRTVTVGLASLIGAYHVDWNGLMTMAVIVSIPSIIGFSFVQRYLVKGLTAGAVKG